MNGHKSSLSFWITIILVVVLAYPLSFGPACWMNYRTNFGARGIAVVYHPIFRLWNKSPAAAGVKDWYGRLAVPGEFTFSIGVDGELVWFDLAPWRGVTGGPFR